MRVRAIMWMAALLCAGPVQAARGCADLGSEPINPMVQWQDVWSALDTQSSCTQNCHLGSMPTAELDLGNRELAIYFLVGQSSSQDSGTMRVVPGNPLASLFYQKIACTHPDVGRRMPPGGAIPLSVQALVWDWIAQGAHGEDPEDPIPREFVFDTPLDRQACIPDERVPRVRTSSLYCLLELNSPLDP
ncbi:MAG: hypothetical protein IT479_10115 [Xanthomonadales bacterium]|nr:hypothetical protein [Xanthomonadales bacterium]MCC6593616.1 hypothetical protein [Xanthomonadales bacterium]MCE7930334.1 hypothetical protein [Xanthomonadales bacterium PRO6]